MARQTLTELEESLVSIARALGVLREKVVFVGGAAVALLVNDEGASPHRPTDDIDAITATPTLGSYTSFTLELSRLGFQPDRHGPSCRWIRDGIRVDFMPPDERILGFSNRWYAGALATATRRTMAGMSIRLIDAAYLVATKLEAFRGRGKGDYLASHDLEDVIALIDGRSSLLEEVAAAAQDLRGYLADELSALLADPLFLEAVPGALAPDEASQGRLPLVLARLERLAGR